MANPVWFNEAYFAGQKVLQAQAMGQTVPEGVNPVTWLNEQIVAWNSDPANADKQVAGPDYAYSNFEACNAFPRYDTTAVARDQVNVSPNELFNVAYYLSAAADSANASGYTAGGVAAGSWTAEAVLKHMYNDNGYTAWEHFKNAGIEQELDCSDKFSTSKYIDLKAAETDVDRAVVKQEILASGLNPIEDFYESGMDKVIDMTQLQPDKAPAAAIMAGSDVWGTGVTPPVPVDVDPYEVDVTPVAIEADNDGPYTSEDGVNTRFDAVWVKAAGESTLAATDVINGGEAFNTLAVELGENWKGFDNSALGKGVDNVTGVGRIVLNRSGEGSERHLDFDASNISEDTVRFDINAKGSGVTRLKNLSDGVEEINISGQKVMDAGNNSGFETTTLKFVNGANAGTDDTLTLGLTGTGISEDGSKLAKVTWDSRFENVVINSKGTAANGIDISDTNVIKGVKEVDIKGAADVTVQTTATGIKTYDMSEATGKVTLNAYNLSDQTVIGGQNAGDGVMLGSTGVVTANNWSGVENVTFGAGGGNTTFNAEGSEGIKAYWIASTGTYKATNVDGDMTVYQTKGAQTTTGATTINGTMDNSTGDSSLNNITWQSQTKQEGDKAKVKANFESNADGTATIKLDGQDFLDEGSSFKFGNASKVVIDSPNDTRLINSMNPGEFVVLTAPKAEEMTVDWTGTVLFAGNTGANSSGTALGKVQNLTLNLENADTANPDSFNMRLYDLVSAQNVTVHGGGESVYLGDLGTATGKNATPDLTLKVTDVNDFIVDKMGVGLGYNVNADISASGDVTLEGITTATNAQSNNQGDVNLTVSGKSVASSVMGGAPINITGGELNIDFSGVTGDVGANAAEVVLDAEESISYDGAAGADIIKVTGVGAGSSSTISTGSGSGGDVVTIAAGVVDATGATAASPNKAEITVDFGSASVEKVYVNGATADTRLVVEVNGAGDDDWIVGGVTTAIASESDASGIMSKFGFSFRSGMQKATLDTSGSNNAEGIVFGGAYESTVYDGDTDTLYLFNDNTVAGATTCIVVNGIECASLSSF